MITYVLPRAAIISRFTQTIPCLWINQEQTGNDHLHFAKSCHHWPIRTNNTVSLNNQKLKQQHTGSDNLHFAKELSSANLHKRFGVPELKKNKEANWKWSLTFCQELLSSANSHKQFGVLEFKNKTEANWKWSLTFCHELLSSASSHKQFNIPELKKK